MCASLIVPRISVPSASASRDRPRFATVVGLAQYGAARLAIGAATGGTRRTPRPTGPGMDKLATRVKTWLQDFF